MNFVAEGLSLHFVGATERSPVLISGSLLGGEDDCPKIPLLRGGRLCLTGWEYVIENTRRDISFSLRLLRI